MKSVLTIFLSLVVISSFAQTFKVDLEPFDELKISRGVAATLVYSTDKELSFDVKGVNKSDVIIEQDDYILTIKIKTKALWETMQELTWWVKVSIPYQSISRISATTGAEILSNTTINSKSLYIDTSSGASVYLTVNANKISVDTSMGAVNKLKGDAESVTIDANMGAVVKAFELKSKYSTVESSMGAVVSVYCSYEFDGSASMGGEINIKGKPSKSFESENMGGSIFSY